MTPGLVPRSATAHVVLWLDDLEPFLNQGVTSQTLAEWQQGAPGRVVAATYGGRGSEFVSLAGNSTLATIAGDVLQRAREIPLEATSAEELLPLQEQLDAVDFHAVGRHGLAAYLVAGPALTRKLATGRHALGEPLCAEGVAIVYAAVDWARCGHTAAIPEDVLREIWAGYLPPCASPSATAFDAGVRWASRPVAGSIALLHVDDGLRAHDYVVRRVREGPASRAPRDHVWRVAISEAEGASAFAVAIRAYDHSRRDDALAALRRACEADDPDIAGVAAFNLAVLLIESGDRERASEAYRDAVASGHRDAAPAADRNLGVLLQERGDLHGARGAFERAVASGHPDQAPKAAINLGNLLKLHGDVAGAKLAYEYALHSDHEDLAPAAGRNLGLLLAEQGDIDGACDAYRRAVDSRHPEHSPAASLALSLLARDESP